VDGSRVLEVTLTVRINLPPFGLDFNSLIAAFWQLGPRVLVRLFELTLMALEGRIGKELQASQPERFLWRGRTGRDKRWQLPFGEARHAYRRMLDRQTGRQFSPLQVFLTIPRYRQLTDAVLAGPVGLSTELSFRKATAESQRMQEGPGPSKSSTWIYFQHFSTGGLDPLPAGPDRTLDVVIADGTKLKRQQRGRNLGHMDVRVVLATTRAGGRLQVAAFGLDEQWPQLKEMLRRDFPDQEVQALLSDGEEEIEALMDGRTRHQRCLIHGPRGFSFALYQDGLKKVRQDRFLQRFDAVDAWRMDARALEELGEKSRYYLLGLADQAKTMCQELLERLPKKARHARSYLERYVQPSLSYIRALLNGEEPLPAVTTNQIENLFGQMTVRLKRIGRRWSLAGALNMLRALLAKALRKEHWREYLELFGGVPGAITIDVAIHSWRWAS
jgi:hypothetical protein